MNHKNVRLLTWFNFCLDFRLYDAVAAVYFANVTGSYALGLSVFSISTVSSIIFEVPTGVISDLLGRKRTIAAGSLASALSVMLYAVGGSFGTLAVGALFGGLSYALFSGNNDALLYDTLKEQSLEKEFVRVQSKTSSMFQFALAVSAGLGSLVLGIGSFKWILWLSVIPQVIGFFLALSMTEPKQHSDSVQTNIFAHLKEAFQAFKDNRKLRMLSLAQMFDYGIGEAGHQFSPAFVATILPIWALGFVRVLNHLFAAVGMRIAGKLSRRFGELKVIIWSQLPGYIVNMLAFIFVTVVTPFINAVMSFPYGLSTIARSSLLQKEFTDRQRATIASLNSVASSALFGIAVFILGVLADHVGPRIAILWSAGAYLIVFYFYYQLFHLFKIKKKSTLGSDG